MDHPLLESIRYANGTFCLLEEHALRIQKARKQLFGLDEIVNLKEILFQTVPQASGTFKCRLLYGKSFGMPEWIPYEKRPILSLQAVEGEKFDYSLKYSNRSAIEALLKLKGPADDILIIREGKITDTSYCNIVFGNSHGWFTPDRPLLEGVQRGYLLRCNIIQEATIELADIKNFTHYKLINAMLPWNEAEAQEISSIFT